MALEHIARLKEAFDLWAAEIIRLSQKVVRVRLAGTTDMINGYTFEDLHAIISAEVKVHADRRDNPHRLTLDQLPGKGVSKASFDGYMKQGITKSACPISEYPATWFNITDNILSIVFFGNIWYYRGYFVSAGQWRLELQDVPKQYVHYKTLPPENGSITAYRSEVYLSTSDAESETDQIKMWIEKIDGVFYAMYNPWAFLINGYRLSQDFHGRAIPVSQGLTAEPGQSVANAWFS